MQIHFETLKTNHNTVNKAHIRPFGRHISISIRTHCARVPSQSDSQSPGVWPVHSRRHYKCLSLLNRWLNNNQMKIDNINLAIKKENYWIVSIPNGDFIYHKQTDFHRSNAIFKIGKEEFIVIDRKQGSIARIQINSKLEIIQVFFALIYNFVLSEIKVDKKIVVAVRKKNKEHITLFEYDIEKAL